MFRCTGVVAWVTVYVILGDTAAPGGQLFGLVVLTVAANFGGFLISLTTLPRLIGMLIVGIIFQVRISILAFLSIRYFYWPTMLNDLIFYLVVVVHTVYCSSLCLCTECRLGRFGR